MVANALKEKSTQSKEFILKKPQKINFAKDSTFWDDGSQPIPGHPPEPTPEEADVRFLRENDQVIKDLWQSIEYGGSRLEAIPRYVKRIINENRWQRRWVKPLGQVVEFDTFEGFLTADLPEGMRYDMESLKRLCRDDPEALDALDRVVQKPVGIHKGKGDIDNVNITESPSGNSRVSALRRLRSQRPDLHTLVLAGEMTPHAAMVQAGFRRKTITVVPDIDGFAKAILGALTPEQRRDLSAKILG